MLKFRFALCQAGILTWGLAVAAFGSSLEQQIRSGATSTSQLIVPYHPRLWMKGNWDWDYNNAVSFAWRIIHGQQSAWPWLESPANDQSKGEFAYSAGADEADDYGADNMFQSYAHDFGIRVLEPLIAGKAQKLNWGSVFSGSYDLDHSADEYLADARSKLMYVVDLEPIYEFPYVVALVGSVGYDWLVDETFTNGSAVLSAADRTHIQSRLIVHADFLKSQASGNGNFFKATDTDNYYYILVGLVLYEPAKVNDPQYAAINAKAESYLDAFDADFIGKVLAAWNEQGGDGGWHGGLTRAECPYWLGGAYERDTNVAILTAAPLLFAHYTATGVAIENSLFSTGVLKHFAEFQAHMIRPAEISSSSGVNYVEIGGANDRYGRSPWIMPMRAYSRRRFSANAEQLRLAELGAWIRTSFNKTFTDYGSWDTMDQLLFEDKWVNPRSPEEIGFPKTRRFEKLGWVFMRTGFTKANDLSALFICQRYHWSHLDPYAQNSFMLERRGKLIEGFNNTIKIDDQDQRTISAEAFPKISQGVQAYAAGSTFDVGPGIVTFASTSSYDYVMGDATHAYDRNKLEKFTRQLVYWKPDKFVILDRVVTKSASTKKSWILDPGANPVTQGDGLILIDNGTGALWCQRLLPQQATATISASQIEIVPGQQSNESVFLHVMQVAESGQSKDSPAITVDDAKVLVVGDTMGVILKGDSILFAADGGLRIALNSSSTGVKTGSSDAKPEKFNLNQNSPNPLFASTQISYDLGFNSDVELAVFNILGQCIRTLVRGKQAPGLKTVTWDGLDDQGIRVVNGVYLYRLKAKGYSVTKKMVFVH